MYHSTLGWRAIKNKEGVGWRGGPVISRNAKGDIRGTSKETLEAPVDAAGNVDEARAEEEVALLLQVHNLFVVAQVMSSK